MKVAGTWATLKKQPDNVKIFILNVFTLTILDIYQDIFVCYSAVHHVATMISFNAQLITHFSFPSHLNKVKAGEHLF